MRFIIAVLALIPSVAVAETASEWCRIHNVGCDGAEPRVYGYHAWVRPKPDMSIVVRRRAAIERERARELREERIEERRMEGRISVPTITCKGPRRAIGEEHVKLESAQAAADRAWEAAVSYDHGRRFMDLSNARHITHTCSRSRPSKEGIVGQAADAAGLFYTVCVTQADPCAPAAIEDDGK